MIEKSEVIIVGAGPAGIACACVLAKAGVNVIVLERGGYPGSKNLIGGILFTPILSRIIPEFLEEAPVERYIKERKFSLLSTDTELGFSFRTEKFSQPPHNNSFTVLRAKFDHWFAQKAEAVGATILTDVIVDELIWENNKCIGLKTRLDDGELHADVVVLAEGANSVIAEKEGLKPISKGKNMAVAVKEIISLPPEVIEERFHLADSKTNGKIAEGVAVEYFGDSIKGMFGNGFIYTNKDSLSVGVGCTLDELTKKKLNPYDVLEHFMNHPCIVNLLRGGKSSEYSAHMIPEGGYYFVPQLVFDGLLMIGDCAGLVNTSHFHEGTNLAMASGMYAAETIIKARKQNDYSYHSLSAYEKRLRNSFVIKDMKKFKNFPSLGEKCPGLLSKYPEVFAELITEYFSVKEKPKNVIEQEIVKKFMKEFGIVKPVKDMISLIEAMGWI